MVTFEEIVDNEDDGMLQRREKVLDEDEANEERGDSYNVSTSKFSATSCVQDEAGHESDDDGNRNVKSECCEESCKVDDKNKLDECKEMGEEDMDEFVDALETLDDEDVWVDVGEEDCTIIEPTKEEVEEKTTDDDNTKEVTSQPSEGYNNGEKEDNSTKYINTTIHSDPQEQTSYCVHPEAYEDTLVSEHCSDSLVEDNVNEVEKHEDDTELVNANDAQEDPTEEDAVPEISEEEKRMNQETCEQLKMEGNEMYKKSLYQEAEVWGTYKVSLNGFIHLQCYNKIMAEWNFVSGMI